LFALAEAIHHGNQLLLALGRGPHEYQDALAIFLQSDVEVYAVGPDVHILLTLQGSRIPRLVVLLPGADQACDRGGRQPRRVFAQQRLQGLGEATGAHAFEVEPGDQILDALGLSQIGRKDLRAEALDRLPVDVDGIAVVVLADNPAIVDPALADLHRPHAGDDGAPWQASVAHHLAMTLLVDRVLVRPQPVLNLRLDRLTQQSLSPVAENLGQNIL